MSNEQGFVTVHDLAVYRGLETRSDGSYTAADIDKVGLALIGDLGWTDVAQANADIFRGREN